MIRVPLQPEPNQTLTVTLAGQVSQIAVRQNGGQMYFTLLRDTTPIVTTRLCRDRARLLVGFEYRGYVGDFMFIDTQGSSDPTFMGLGTRFALVYLENGE